MRLDFLRVPPQGLELSLIVTHQSWLAQNQDILVILLLGGEGPVVAAGDHHAVVEEGELVVHLGTGTVTSVSNAARKSGTRQELPRGCTLWIPVAIDHQSNPDSLVVHLVQRACQA